MKTIIASLLLLILPDAIQFQAPLLNDDKVQVQGKVIDADTQHALVGATIRFIEASEHKTADTNGDFEIYVEPGTYTVEVSYVGFKKSSKKVNVPKSGLKNLLIALDPSPIMLADAVVLRYESQRMQSKTVGIAGNSYYPSPLAQASACAIP